jgi:type II secretory pathway component PulF
MGTQAPKQRPGAVIMHLLGTDLDRGTHLFQALETAASTAADTDPELSQALYDVRDKLKDGDSLQELFGQHPNIFDKQAVAIIEEGNNSGSMEKAFPSLAHYWGYRA